MEASSIPAAAAPRVRARPAVPVVGPLLRLRSDEQLVRLFRAGNEDAFRVIHDRYRARLFAYTRQMLPGSRQDAEDALQDVFVRAYAALRSSDRDISLRAWLYRVAHNRCIDELRRPSPPPPETLERLQPPASDPLAETERKESLRRLVADVRRLPEQQRSALLMREIVGMSYAELAAALDVTVPAVKSLLVRARMGLAQAAEARDTACARIREELTDAHDRGVRVSGLARRHLHDCAGCRAYRRELRAMRQRFAALAPTLGPFALVARLLGLGGSGAAAGSSAAGGGAGAAGAAAGGAAVAGTGLALGGGVSAGQVAAVVAAAVVGAGGAVEVKRTLTRDAPVRAVAADVRPAVPVARHAAAVAAVQVAPAPARDAAVGAPRPAAPSRRDPAAARGTRARPRAPAAVAPIAAAPRAPAAEAERDPGNGGAAPPADAAPEPPASATRPADATAPPASDDAPAAPVADPAAPGGTPPAGTTAPATPPSPTGARRPAAGAPAPAPPGSTAPPASGGAGTAP